MKFSLDKVLQFVRPMGLDIDIEVDAEMFRLKKLTVADIAGLETTGTTNAGDEEIDVDQRVMGYIKSLFEGVAPHFLDSDLRRLRDSADPETAAKYAVVRNQALALLDLINKIFIAMSILHEKKGLALAAEESDRQVANAFGASGLTNSSSV